MIDSAALSGRMKAPAPREKNGAGTSAGHVICRESRGDPAHTTPTSMKHTKCGAGYLPNVETPAPSMSVGPAPVSGTISGPATTIGKVFHSVRDTPQFAHRKRSRSPDV